MPMRYDSKWESSFCSCHSPHSWVQWEWGRYHWEPNHSELSHRIETSNKNVQGAYDKDTPQGKVVDDECWQPIFFQFKPTITEQIEAHAENSHECLKIRDCQACPNISNIVSILPAELLRGWWDRASGGKKGAALLQLVAHISVVMHLLWEVPHRACLELSSFLWHICWHQALCVSVNRDIWVMELGNALIIWLSLHYPNYAIDFIYIFVKSSNLTTRKTHYYACCLRISVWIIVHS